MKQRFDWSLIQSFLAALDQGSLLGAARVLNASQPTIGRHIATLEQQLGSALFERTGRQLVPTQIALGIAEHARLMEGSANAIGRVLTAQDDRATGTVRITASQATACHLLPPILARLRQQEPGIAIELVASNQISNLLRREADIAVRMVRPEQDSLIARRLGDATLGAYAHHDYLRRRGEPLEPKDLLQHDLIGFDTDESIIRGFAKMGYVIDKHVFCFRSDDHIALWQALRAGLGIGFAANYVGREDESVRRILHDLPSMALPVWLTVHREIRSSHKIRVVYDFLAEAISAVLVEAPKS